MGAYAGILKPLADKLVALLLLALTLPLFILLIIVLRVAQGQVWFIQARPGLGGVPFPLLKFCTMRPNAAGELVVTPIGHLFRRSSLDELPQLFNILAGQMSLVGPRPLLMEYLPLYSARQRQRHKVLPGLTGLAQVLGRNNPSWDTRLAADVYYAQHQSFMLDLWILIRTPAVLLRPGKGHAEKLGA